MAEKPESTGFLISKLKKGGSSATGLIVLIEGEKRPGFM